MSNKIRVADYQIKDEDGFIYVEFILWLQSHPNGGTFIYKDYRLEVKPQ